MGDISNGGSFVLGADYTPTGNWTFPGTVTITGSLVDTGTTLASPVISGTVTGSASYTAPTITSPTVTGTTTIGAGATITSPALVAPTFTGIQAGTTTITAATIAASTRYLQSSIVLTPATTFSVTGSNSLAAVRGDITLTTGKTFQDGFLYGVNGKFILNGTMNQTSAGRAVGVIGQVDLDSGTVTTGQVSAIWADMQGSSPTISNDEVNVLRVTNSTSTTLNAMVFFYGQSNYLFTAGRDGGTPVYFGAAAPTSLAKSLKISVGGVDYYIGLYTAAS